MRRLAVVTGASTGIGFHLARQFALHEFDLLITANEDLGPAQADLEALGARVTAVRADLRQYDEIEDLYARIRAAGPIDALALNAGVGASGPFAEGSGPGTAPSLTQELDLVAVNVTSLVHLARRVLPDLVGQGAGKVLITSSVAATQPGPYEAVYAASKAFGHSFAQGLRTELKDSGVSVTVLLPGPVATSFFDRAEMGDTRLGAGPKDDPQEVARQAYEALMAGKDQVVAGSVVNQVLVTAERFLPERVKAAAHQILSRPGSAPGHPDKEGS
ncbi:oxidoreductase [Kineosporia sp. NBRC 101677]|uniref:SDR family NAD(P)-dependent oxidoreductase n=1 Tax=Kineosporia sp. NBRC 101677 TaxID=3032197 RepID=UPI0024A16514|nr:SDR family NAD(P)-dependent oxidoreductase [Kineosporia sp. NBRC 101677]GLY16005.1 oxidoreductase [Kineosporia sp. NBRC 101677]